MSTYVERKDEFRKFRAELDKNMDTYQQGINAARAELDKATAAYKAREKELTAAYKKRDAELNDLLKNIKQTTDSQMLDDIIKDLNREEDIERNILRELEEQGDFITPNQSAFDKYSPAELFQAISNLINKGILRKRDCEGTAYEYAR